MNFVGQQKYRKIRVNDGFFWLNTRIFAVRKLG